MSTRRVLEQMVELAPAEILPKILRGLSMQGIRPQFKIGQIWCHYDAEREVFYDANNIQVSTGATFDKVMLTQINWNLSEASRDADDGTDARNLSQVRGQHANV